MTGQALAASGANKDLRSMPDSQAPARSPAPLTGKAGAAFTNGKPSPTLGSAKIGDVDENKAVDAVGMNAVPTVNGAFSNGDKVDSRHDEAGDKGPDRDVATEEKTSTVPKRSLYVKGIPIPTTQDELKALFNSSNKARKRSSHRLWLTMRCRSPT